MIACPTVFANPPQIVGDGALAICRLTHSCPSPSPLISPQCATASQKQCLSEESRLALLLQSSGTQWATVPSR